MKPPWLPMMKPSPTLELLEILSKRGIMATPAHSVMKAREKTQSFQRRHGTSRTARWSIPSHGRWGKKCHHTAEGRRVAHFVYQRNYWSSSTNQVICLTRKLKLFPNAGMLTNSYLRNVCRIPWSINISVTVNCILYKWCNVWIYKWCNVWILNEELFNFSVLQLSTDDRFFLLQFFWDRNYCNKLCVKQFVLTNVTLLLV